MRYLISQKMSNEFMSRKQYLWEAIPLWTKLMHSNNGFICLEGIPSNVVDVFFIVGHNFLIEHYLNLYLSAITEKTIVAITCDGNINFASFKTPGKALYIPHQNAQNYADLLDGSEYGFNFDLTESEIMFYNNRKSKDVKKRIDLAFTKLH